MDAVLKAKLKALSTAAKSLSDMADTASENATGTTVLNDPLLRAVRQQHNAVRNIAEEFLTIARGSTSAAS